jgi:hypothetical protein
MACLNHFGCFISCSSTSQCAPGSVCTDGICQGCNPALNQCPSGRICVGQSDFGLGTCQ